jgi:hypothetical protein
MLVTTVIFLNHRGRKKNFDTADDNKSATLVKITALSMDKVLSMEPLPHTFPQSRLLSLTEKASK